MNTHLTTFLEILAFAAWHKEHGDRERWQSDDVAAFWKRGLRYYESRLQWLMRSDYLLSKRGPDGGYAYNGGMGAPTASNVIADVIDEDGHWLVDLTSSSDLVPFDLMPSLYKARFDEPFRKSKIKASLKRGDFTDVKKKARHAKMMARAASTKAAA